MAESNGPTQPEPWPPAGPSRRDQSTRRTFMRRVIGGLAIAIPGFGVLVGTVPASAASRMPCNYVKLIRQYCGNLPEGRCPVGDDHKCIQWWGVYNNSGLCYEYSEDVGPCGE